jgi:hypothetical protein
MRVLFCKVEHEEARRVRPLAVLDVSPFPIVRLFHYVTENAQRSEQHSDRRTSTYLFNLAFCN